VVGVSTTGMTLQYDLASRTRQTSSPDVRLIAGGMEATFKPESMLTSAVRSRRPR